MNNREKIKDAIINEIRRKSEEEGWTKAVIGISGGKDSTVCAALLVRALGKENVYGVLLPDGEQKDIKDSLEVVKTLGIRYRIVNISGMHKSEKNAIEGGTHEPEEFDVKLTEKSDINVVPRLRMIVLRDISQSLGARLCGTGNISETYIGYCTKEGDTSCDFNPIGFLTSVEVVELGKVMYEIPRHLVEKPPADGLTGLTDEDNLGIKYDSVHKIIREGGEGVDAKSMEKIENMHRASAHKRRTPYVILEREEHVIDEKYSNLF